MTAASVRVLSVHAAYRCARAGACCTSNWPIAIEPDRLAAVRSALATGQLSAARGLSPRVLFVTADSPTERDPLLATASGACVFFDDTGGRACAIHRALGHDALPLACRQFPRVTTRDPRGASVTLSHYCPTAAGLLERPGRVTIVTNAPAFPAAGEYSGLDATRGLPPLLRPDVLMDWDAWWDLEALAVDLLANGDGPVEHRLARLTFVVETARQWRPGSTSLDTILRDAAATALTVGTPTRRTPLAERIDALAGAARGAVPHEFRGQIPPAGDRRSDVDEAALGRYLAAHAFANWTIHLGRGLRSWLTSIDMACALVRSGLQFRHADLILRHLADPREVASVCAREEQAAD